jgi:hypothetical protein
MRCSRNCCGGDKGEECGEFWRGGVIMPKTDITIRRFSGNKIRVEPTSIIAEGFPGYSRLIIPVKLDLKPLNESGRNEEPFILLDIKCSLYTQDNPFKITDALPSSCNYKVFSPYTPTCHLEFPLDTYRLKEIEGKRKGGDLKINLNFYFVIGIYCPILIQEGEKQKTKHFLNDILTSFTQLRSIEIPQSHWVKNILPSLGYLEYLLVEIPKSNKILLKAWDYLEKAENAFMRWDTQGVFTNCREVGRMLDNEIKNKFGESDSAYTERWGRFNKGFNHWASLDLHREEIKVEVKKADAAHLMFVTKSLIKFAEELLQEKS